MSKFFTSKKLLYWDCLADFLRGNQIVPVTWEMDLTLRCNQNCENCVAGKKGGASLSPGKALKLVQDVRDLGGKGLILTGGGDPSLNPEGIDAVAGIMPMLLFTNGQQLDEAMMRRVLPKLEGIRISLDACDEGSAARWRGIKPEAWKKMIENTAMLVQMRNELGCDTVIGTGYLTNAERNRGIPEFARISTECGVDYAQCRPMHMPPEKFGQDMIWGVEKFVRIFRDAKAKFPVLTQSEQKYSLMVAGEAERTYETCYMGHWASTIGADGKLYFCCHTRYLPEFCVGDLNTQSLREILQSGKIQEIQDTMNFDMCPELCRGDAINRVLDEIIGDPVTHKEFL